MFVEYGRGEQSRYAKDGAASGHGEHSGQEVEELGSGSQVSSTEDADDVDAQGRRL